MQIKTKWSIAQPHLQEIVVIRLKGHRTPVICIFYIMRQSEDPKRPLGVTVRGRKWIPRRRFLLVFKSDCRPRKHSLRDTEN